MSKKLAEKARLIQMPPSGIPMTQGQSHESPSVATSSSSIRNPAAKSSQRQLEGDSDLKPSHESRVKTAPGTMAVFLATQSAAIKEAEDLRQKLRNYEGALMVRRLDPHCIKPSRWANRHRDSLSNQEYLDLRNEIAAAGTNVQPICVRPIQDDQDGQAQYEVVFGHRRHRACADLGLPVQAMIAELDDQQLFESMERENRNRKNLSAWEQGRMYRNALDSGLYSSQRKLAEAIGVDLSLISKSLILARLPDAVVATFKSPLDLQFRWAQPLSEVLQRDPEGLVARAKEIAQSKEVFSAKAIFEHLIASGGGVLNRSTPIVKQRLGKIGRGVVFRKDTNGQVSLTFDVGALSEQQESALLDWLKINLAAPSQAKEDR